VVRSITGRKPDLEALAERRRRLIVIAGSQPGPEGRNDARPRTGPEAVYDACPCARAETRHPSGPEAVTREQWHSAEQRW
jgi:hypothetical protein